MAIQAVWSVDLGKSSLKAVKLRRAQGHVEIVAIDKVDYPVSGNGTDPGAQASDALEIFAERNNIREPIAISHPGQGTFSRFIKVPAFDEKKVNEMVGHEAAQQIPFPLDEVTWDFHIVDRDYLPGEEREVAIFAVRREQIDDFILEFTNQELAVETVSIGYLGLLNFVQHDIAPDEPAIVLDIGAAHTDLVLVDGNRFWIRPLPHSGNDITKSIQERFKLGFAEAEKLKIETAKVPQRAVKIFQAVIQPKLKELVGEIHRSIGFYRSQHGEVNFTKLYLLGNGSKVIGIVKFLKESLGLDVERVQSINHFRVSRDVNLRVLQAHLPAFASTLGCGLQALGLAPCDVDLVPSEEKLAKEVGRKKKHVFIAGAIVLVAMLISSWLIGSINSSAKQAVSAADEATDELNEGGEARNEHLAQKKELETIVGDLRKLAGMRARALKGLQALDKALESYAENGRSFEVTVASDGADTAETQMREELDASIRQRVWIPRVDMERATWTPPKELVQAPKDEFMDEDEDEAPATPEKIEPIPAYKFTIELMITKRANQQETVGFVRDKFGAKLAEEFKNQGLQVVPKDNETKPPILVGKVTSELGTIGPAGEGARNAGEEGQEGYPFDSVEVSWLVVEKIPTPPKKESAGDGEESLDGEDVLGDDDDDDDDTGVGGAGADAGDGSGGGAADEDDSEI